MKLLIHLDVQMEAYRLRPPNWSALLRFFFCAAINLRAFPQIPIFSFLFPPENLYQTSKFLYRRPEELAKPPISVIIPENLCTDAYVNTESTYMENKNQISYTPLADHEKEPQVGKFDADDESCAVCLEKDADAVQSLFRPVNPCIQLN